MAVSDKTGRRRLLKLADMLEKDAKKKKGLRFDLSIVVEPFRGDYTNNYQPEPSCGTVGCAMGLAAVSGAFKGLSSQAMFYKTVNGISYGNVDLLLDKKVVTYDEAASKLFRIDRQSAIFLFSPTSYQSRSGYEVHVKGAKGELRVAKRIRNFVAGKLDPTVDFSK